MSSIVDTNVVLVANGQHHDVTPACIASCAIHLQSLMTSGKIAIDDAFNILLEYQKKTQPKTGNRPGDAFVKWALQNNANKDKCDLVTITENAQRGFEEFPEDSRLADFDPPDRKFVAVAMAHPEQPPILQATDSKWINWSDALAEHGVEVTFLCPDDIACFHENKFGK